MKLMIRSVIRINYFPLVISLAFAHNVYMGNVGLYCVLCASNSIYRRVADKI